MAQRGRTLISLHYPTKGARKVIEEQARRLPAGFGRAMDTAGKIYKEKLADYSPVGKGEKPGKLKAGWKVKRISSGGTASRNIYNTQRYLKWVLKGRPAIDQRGKPNAKRLRFVVSGVVIYRWKVKKAEANPFHLRAAVAARREINIQLHGDMRNIFTQIHNISN